MGFEGLLVGRNVGFWFGSRDFSGLRDGFQLCSGCLFATDGMAVGQHVGWPAIQFGLNALDGSRVGDLREG